MRPELIRAIDLLGQNTPESVEEAIGLLQKTVYSFSMKVCGHPDKKSLLAHAPQARPRSGKYALPRRVDAER
jgi:hypothetical protein